MRPGGYSVSVNYRTTDGIMTERLDFNAFEDIHVVGRLLARRWSVALCVRHALHTFHDYASAVDFLSTAELISPCYIVVAGTFG